MVKNVLQYSMGDNLSCYLLIIFFVTDLADTLGLLTGGSQNKNIARVYTCMWC